MRTYSSIFAGLAFMSLVTVTQADVKLPNVFGSNMVLQRQKNIPVWGWAAPGENVKVAIAGQTKEIKAGKDGKWKLELAPIKAGGPFKMEVNGNNKIVFSNVMVGEVWLCSGQSNMQWSVRACNNAAKEIANAKYPNIRLLQVPRSWNNVPQNNVSASWTECNPQTVANFSAAGYYFGRELHKKLNIPIGLIHSSWGGSRIEPFTPPVGFQMIPQLKSIATLLKQKNPESAEHKKLTMATIKKYENWVNAAKQAVAANKILQRPPVCPAEILPFTNRQQPTVTYNSMINPLVPYALRGAIWYQGESNRHDGMLYMYKMKALIESWRKIWNDKDMPFYFVQIAPFTYGGSPYTLPLLWQAQIATLSIPDTGMAVINDIGNLRNIHPKNKQEVGRRLALLALNKTYGKKDVVCDAPLFKSFKTDGNKAIVTFKNAAKLKTRDGKAPTWFEICGIDGVYKKANAVIEEDTVVLTEKSIDKPYAVRFAWHQLAVPNLVNEAGLPASAFKAGEVPMKGKMEALVPESKAYKLLLALDPTRATKTGSAINYVTDKRKEITGTIESVAYYLELISKNGKTDYVFVSMAPFTKDINKLGVPDTASKARFQQKVKDLFVKSNVAGIKNGTFAEGGNIEFWPSNYAPQNSAKIPSASSSIYDFGDKPASGSGYGSMQVHNYTAKQTVFAFNHWTAGRDADLGIGNSPKGHKDWTFQKNAGQYASGKLLVLVKTK
jgi:sialate O-acetylesterase